ncbi:hypothetical protein P3T36_005450, partial [Kitasatospora sp. MAP12-15]
MGSLARSREAAKFAAKTGAQRQAGCFWFSMYSFT